MTSYRALSANRDFTALWVAATVSELGSRVAMFAMPLVAFLVTGSAFAAAAAEAVHLGGMVLALVPSGVVADRSHRLHVMRWAMAAGALAHGSLVVAGVAGALTLPHLLVVTGVAGMAAGFFDPAETSALRDVVAPEDMPTAMSQVQARQHVANLLGGPIGGALFGVTRWLPFLVDAVGYVAGWVLLGRVRADLSARPRPAGEESRPWRDLVEGIRWVAGHRVFRLLLVVNPMLNLAINALFFVALLRLVEGGTPAWQIGLAEAVVGACGILGALVAPVLIERVPTGRLFVVSIWSFAPVAVPLALWNSPVMMALAGGVGLLLNPAGNAGMGAYRMAVAPPEIVGRVQAAVGFVSRVTMPLSPLVAGVLLESSGGSGAILACAALTALVCLPATFSSAVRAVPRPAQWAARSEPRVAVGVR